MSETARQNRQSPASTPTLRIVIADDHEPTRVLLRTLIELEGMQVVGEAEDGTEAVTLALEQRADVVLLDVNMPRLDGLSAAELIRARRPQTRLLLHTGDPNGTTRRRAAALGLPLIDKLNVHKTIEHIALPSLHARSTTAASGHASGTAAWTSSGQAVG
ncbi:MAG: response regulator transcription factor [Gaiellaceae bacterium]